MNRGGGRFEETALAAEVAFSANGKPRSSMGVDTADYDGDGRAGPRDRQHRPRVRSRSTATAATPRSPTRPSRTASRAATTVISCWGVRFFDYDDDGWPDLLLANGHPDDMLDGARLPRALPPAAAAVPQRGRPLPQRERRGRAGLPQGAQPSRGLAVGDYDNDGRLDVLIATTAWRPLLLHNEAARPEPLARREAAGHDREPRRGRRARALVGGRRGARATQGGRRQLPLVARPAAACSASAPRGPSTGSRSRWPLPSGRVERFAGLAADRYVTLVEGRAYTRAAFGRPQSAGAGAGLGFTHGRRRLARPLARSAARGARGPAASGRRSPRRQDPYTRVQQARALIERGRVPARARRSSTRLLKEYPRRSRATCCAGWRSTSWAGCDEAERSYQTALQVARRRPADPRGATACTTCERDRWPDAIRGARAERRQRPRTRSRTSTWRRPTSTRTRRHRRSRRSRRARAARAPRNPTILVKLGEYRAQASRFPPALEALRRAQQLEPRGAGARPRARGRAPRACSRSTTRAPRSSARSQTSPTTSPRCRASPRRARRRATTRRRAGTTSG